MSPDFNDTPRTTSQHHEARGTSKSLMASWASTPARRVVSAVCVMGLTGAITLLFWKKLQLVTGVPRTAYAVPETKTEPKPENKAENPDAKHTPEASPHAQDETARQPN